MALPVIPLATRTVVLAGHEVTVRALSRAETIKLPTEFRGRPDDAEDFMVAQATGVSIGDAAAWRAATHPDLVGELIEAIADLSGLRPKAKDEAKEADPQPPTSAPSSRASSTPSSTS
jgi:hypothetical protein